MTEAESTATLEQETAPENRSETIESDTPAAADTPAETTAGTNGEAAAEAPAESIDPRSLPIGTVAPATPEEVEALRVQVSELGSKLDRLNMHEHRVLELEQIVSEREGEWDDAKEAAKEAKERFDLAVSDLRAAIRRRDGQNELPFRDETQHPAEQANSEGSAVNSEPPKPLDDPAGKITLAAMGLTENQCEKLAGVDVETVAQLEAYIAAGNFVPGKIKGLGDTAIHKISDKLIEFRAANPNPNQSAPAPVQGEYDLGQFSAGQIAFADGKGIDANPNVDGFISESWLAGWYAKQALQEPGKASDAQTEPDKGPSLTAEQAIEQCDRIVKLILEVDNEAATEFCESVASQVDDVRGWIATHDHVTEEQLTALANWEAGVSKWLPENRE